MEKNLHNVRILIIAISVVVMMSVVMMISSATVVYGASVTSTADGDLAQKSGSNDVSELMLEYGDYYTFEDALYVRTSRSSVVSAKGKTIHAKDVTEDAVRVKVFDRRLKTRQYDVKVKKAKLNFAVIDGQSNAAGIHGIRDKEAEEPPRGCAFAWANNKIIDLEDSYPEHVRSVGFHPAIAAEWYALTGEKTLFLNVARSGMPVGSWYSEGYAEQTVKMIEKILGSIDANKFELKHTGYYWLQGESDSDADTDRYQYDLDGIHHEYITALKVPGLTAPYGGILAVGTMRELLGYNPSHNSEYNGPRAAQQALANKYADLYMASVISDSWDRFSKAPYTFTSDMGITISGSDTSLLFNGIHFNQSAYDIMGLEAADSIYKGHVCGQAASDFSVIGYDGVTDYPNRSVINAGDNERYECRDASDRNAAQIVVVPSPFYGRCADVSMTLTDSSDKARTDIMGDNGWLPDYTALSEPMKLTVTVNGNSKKYILTRDGLPEPDIELEHEATKVEAVKATDKKPGNIEYWKCGTCGRMFRDEACTKEISKSATVIPKNNMTVKAKKLKVRAKKKTGFKATKAFTVKNAKGSLTYRKIKGSRKISVSPSGKVTVKKGLRPGKTYKVTVKVSSKETMEYAVCTRKVTLYIKCM